MVLSVFLITCAVNRVHSIQQVCMATEGKIKVDEHYPTDVDEPPLFDAKKIDKIRSNVKFDQCYECSQLIGDGKFGKVYQVREKETGQEFAAKVIRIKKQADRQEVEREVAILTQLRHPRIAQIYDAFYTSNNEVVLVMEIVRGGELFDRVADENYVLTELAVVMIICQLCEAIDYIHEQNILHLDIKPENIMCVSQRGNRIKLIDFGLARYYDGTQELRYMAGTPEFAAPEVIKYEQLDFHTDMWSVGVITYILLSGYSPFLGENIAETYCNVERGVWEFTEEFDSVSNEGKDFISRLIVYNKEKRMLPKECLAHPWISTHRAKVSCDANLEQPAGGPIMDNRQMLRYNAKRKLRRMFIYVKFLIEVNRLRSMIKDRMSQSGKKYFEPLLKIAEENQKQASQAMAPKESMKSLKVAKLEKVIVSSKLNTMKENDGRIDDNDKEQQRIIINKNAKSCGLSSPDKSRSPPVQMLAMVRFDESKLNKVAPEKSLNRLKAENIDKEEEMVSNNFVREMMPKTTAQNSISVQEVLRTPGKTDHGTQKIIAPELITTDRLRKFASCETVNTFTNSITSLVNRRLHSTDKLLEKPAVSLTSAAAENKFASAQRPTLRAENKAKRSEHEKKPLSADSTAAKPPHQTTAVSTKSTTSKKKSAISASKNASGPSVSLDETKIIDNNLHASCSGKKPSKKTSLISDEERSLGTKKSSAPEAIINVPAKKTVLGAPKIVFTNVDKCSSIRMQRFGSTESGDSAKENRNVEEKKPTRQGALRKKEKSNENLAIITQPQLVSSTQSTTFSASLPRKQAYSDVPLRLNEIPSETKPISPRPGSSIHERLLKLNACVAPISLNVVSDSKVHQNDPKSEDKLALKRSDCKETRTTTSCEASTITRTTISHKVPVSSKIGSAIDGKLSKLDNGALRPAIHITSDLNRQQKVIQENKEAQSQTKLEQLKKPRALPMTKESKTTTTTLTSTSTKKRKTSMEKKVQHVSPEKSVEEMERSATEQDNSNTCQITVIKVESKGVPKSTTFMKKNVIKEESVRSTGDKDRIEEKNADSKKKRTTRSTVIKTTDKVTIGEYSEEGGKPTKLGLTGTKNVVKKMSEHSEVDCDAEGKPVTNTETASVEKMKTALDIEKNSKRSSLISTTMTEETTKASEAMSDTLETNSTIPVTVTKSTTVELHRTDNVATGKKKRSTITGTSEKSSHHIPRDDFSFSSLREKLVRRLSTDSEKSSSTVKSQCISIPTINSVRDRMKRFECRN